MKVKDLGTVPYLEAVALQRQLRQEVAAGAPNQLLLLEHPPTYTRGRRSEESELPYPAKWYQAQGVEIYDTERGGRVTYHGPGQLVAYPIVDLSRANLEVVGYIRLLEDVIVEALSGYGVVAERNFELTGVWCGDRKIASIGIHVSRGVTMHGFAINASCNLAPFEWITPCGIDNCGVTSISKELGSDVGLADLKRSVTALITKHVETPAVELAL